MLWHSCVDWLSGKSTIFRAGGRFLAPCDTLDICRLRSGASISRPDTLCAASARVHLLTTMSPSSNIKKIPNVPAILSLFRGELTELAICFTKPRRSSKDRTLNHSSDLPSAKNPKPSVELIAIGNRGFPKLEMDQARKALALARYREPEHRSHHLHEGRQRGCSVSDPPPASQEVYI